MSYQVHKQAPCRECGEMTNRRERNSRDPLCLECAIQKMTDAAIQQQRRTGPYYEKWRKAMSRKFAN